MGIKLNHLFCAYNYIFGLSAAVDFGINSKMPPLDKNDFFGKLVEGKVVDFVNDAIGGAVMGGSPDLQTLVTQELGSTMGEFGGEFLPDTEKGGEHQSSKELYKNGTKQSSSYVESQAHAKGVGSRKSYIPSTPDIKDETDNTKYDASVNHSTNKPVTSTNRSMVKGMDDTGGNSYLKQAIKAQLDKEMFGGVGINSSNTYVNITNKLLANSTLNKVNQFLGGCKYFRAVVNTFDDIMMSFVQTTLMHPINTMENIALGLGKGLMDTGYWVQKLYSSPKEFFPEFGSELKTELTTGWDITKQSYNILNAGGPRAFALTTKIVTNLALLGLGGEFADTAKILGTAGKGGDIIKTATNSHRFFTKGGKGLGVVSDVPNANVVSKSVKSETVLYQKVGPNGEHLKFGITKNPETRYTKKQLGGGRLKIIARGEKSEMLSLERNLHEILPIGSEEGQMFYIDKQVENGLIPPPY